MMGRQATSTRIWLLTEHSFLATGIVRRHANDSKSRHSMLVLGGLGRVAA